MKKAIAIIGARPQFIKHFPFEKACEARIDLITIHTGQHYDEKMSDVFFNQLGMKKPHYLLNTGGGNHGVQTGKMMTEIEEIILKEKPDLIFVYGDTNSTLAGALVGSKLHIPIAHIEAGLRSFNKKMPEEINRILTDHVSEWLFCPSTIAVNNLSNEGVTKGVSIIGDLMKDLIYYAQKNNGTIKPDITENYYYVTLHRPYNVDEKNRLSYVLENLNMLDRKAVFAIHPRTRNAMSNFGMQAEDYQNISFIDPQPYFENLGYLQYSSGLITDSGGMQKEAYWLQKKCVTIRTETEWLETLDNGWNELLFDDLSELSTAVLRKPIAWNENLYGSGFGANEILDTILF